MNSDRAHFSFTDDARCVLFAPNHCRPAKDIASAQPSERDRGTVVRLVANRDLAAYKKIHIRSGITLLKDHCVSRAGKVFKKRLEDSDLIEGEILKKRYIRDSVKHLKAY